MKKTILICAVCCVSFINKSLSQSLPLGPKVYTNHFKTIIKNGDVFDCSNDNLEVKVKFTKEMLKYDVLSVLLYITYSEGKYDDETIVAYKTFFPTKKEYALKYAKLDSISIYFLKDNNYPDEIITGGNFAVDAKNIYCPKPFYKDNHYFFVIKGFIKTGEHATRDKNGNVRMENDYDKGTELTSHSVFKVPLGKE